jgi:signal transduction histidine kinase
MSESMNRSIRGNPRIDDLERESWLSASSAGDSTDSRAIAADAQTATIAKARQERDAGGRVWRPERTTPYGPYGRTEALRALSGQCLALKARNRQLAGEVRRLRAERRHLRSRLAAVSALEPVQTPRVARACPALAREDERRRLERDLHDGVQNELVALIVKLRLVEEDRDTPPALAGTLAALGARAEAAPESVRETARGVYPPLLAAFGVGQALRAQAARASVDVSMLGIAPRSSDEAEAAVYFSCLEAIQNVAKHAGGAAHVTLRLHHDHGTLAGRIEDDGRGFDPAHTADGAGLRNINDRIQTLGGAVKLTSSPGRGTVLTISLPWPPKRAKDDPDRPSGSAVVPTSMTPAGMAPRSCSRCAPCAVPRLRRPAAPADGDRADDGPVSVILDAAPIRPIRSRDS